MSVKKRVAVCTVAILLLAGCIIFLWPRSFGEVGEPELVQSAWVVVVDLNMPPEPNATTEYEYDRQDPEFTQLMEILDRYSYHMSLRTIPTLMENGSSMEGNDAGYWVNIYLYTADECYSISTGGTGEVSVDHGTCDTVYRMGYWGNSKAIAMMEEIRGLVES